MSESATAASTTGRRPPFGKTKFAIVRRSKLKKSGHPVYSLRIHLVKAVAASQDQVDEFIHIFRRIYEEEEKRNRSFALWFQIMKEGLDFSLLANLGRATERVRQFQKITREMWPRTLHSVGCTCIQVPEGWEPIANILQEFFTRKINPPVFVDTDLKAAEIMAVRMSEWPSAPKSYGTVKALGDGKPMTAERIEIEKKRMLDDHARLADSFAKRGGGSAAAGGGGGK